MKAFFALVKRNTKLFFKDKGVFFPSLITPLILLFLFVAFLGNVYRDSIRSVAEISGIGIEEQLVESIASGWLISSLVAVCAVTIAFTANIVMVQDKVQGQLDDLLIAPVKRSTVALAYFVSTYLVTLLVCTVALLAGFIYMGIVGWELTAGDVFLALLDIALLALFGTAFSSVVCSFLRSQGSIAAVQATISSAYGFVCGAYMPLGSLTAWIRNAVMFLPGTYGTGLIRMHLMGRAIDSLPAPAAAAMREGFDCTLLFFEHAVPVWACYLVVALVTLALVGGYIALCFWKGKGTKGHRNKKFSEKLSQDEKNVI